MLKPRFVAWMVAAGMMVLGAGAASGQATLTGSGQAYPQTQISSLASLYCLI